MTLDRVLFQTQGVPGTIWFGSRGIGDIGPSTRLSRFAGRGFHQPFPFNTLVCFGGCRVSAADSGTQFLVEAGDVFTRLGAGEVFAFTNPGYGLPGWMPFTGGKTYHPGAPLKGLQFLAGGIVVGSDVPHLDRSVIA